MTFSDFPSRNGCTFAAEKNATEVERNFHERKRNQKRKEQYYENHKSNNPRSDGPGAGNACCGTTLAQWRTRWRQPWWFVDERTESQQRPLAQQQPELQQLQSQQQYAQPQQQHAQS